MSYDYDDKILKIKVEFINALKKDLETRSDKNIDQKEINNKIGLWLHI